MKRFSPIVLPVVALLLSGMWIFHPSAQFAQDRGRDLSGAKGETSFRIVFGIGDKEPTVWDGSVRPTSARITGIRGFNFAAKDTTDGKSSWTVSTRTATPSGAQRRAGRPGHMSENGILLSAVLDSPDANFEIKTKQGSFSFRASELPYGKSKTVVAATPSHTNMRAHSARTAAISANSAQAAPQAVKTWTAKAATMREAGAGFTGGSVGSILSAYTGMQETCASCLLLLIFRHTLRKRIHRDSAWHSWTARGKIGLPKLRSSAADRPAS